MLHVSCLFVILVRNIKQKPKIMLSLIKLLNLSKVRVSEYDEDLERAYQTLLSRSESWKTARDKSSWTAREET